MTKILLAESGDIFKIDKTTASRFYLHTMPAQEDYYMRFIDTRKSSNFFYIFEAVDSPIKVNKYRDKNRSRFTSKQFRTMLVTGTAEKVDDAMIAVLALRGVL